MGVLMAAYSGCGERDGGIGHGKRRSRTGLARVGGDVGALADGRRQAGSGMARSRARARLNFSSQGQSCGRCRVRRRAERVRPPGQGEDPSSEGLGGHDLFAQTDSRRPAGQVVGHRLYRQPGGVGGEAAGRQVVQPDTVLEVSDGILDLGVAAMISLQIEHLPVLTHSLSLLPACLCDTSPEQLARTFTLANDLSGGTLLLRPTGMFCRRP